MRYIVGLTLGVVVGCSGSGEPPPSECLWSEGGSYDDLDEQQRDAVAAVEVAITTRLDERKRGYLVALRYASVDATALQSDPVVVELFAAARSQVSRCARLARLTQQQCDNPWWVNLGQCWAAEGAACPDCTTLRCVAWASAVSAGFGCGTGAPEPETVPAVEPADPEAWDVSPGNLACDPPCRDATRCNEGAGTCEVEPVCPNAGPSAACHADPGSCGCTQACGGSNYVMSCTQASSVLSCTCQRDGQPYYQFSIFAGQCGVDVFAKECGPDPSPT